jgi:hypothetical protein
VNAVEPETFGLVCKVGTVTLYHRDEVNQCPECQGTQWHIGRVVAECVRCKAAFPLVSPNLPTEMHLEEAA